MVNTPELTLPFGVVISLDISYSYGSLPEKLTSLPISSFYLYKYIISIYYIYIIYSSYYYY